MSYFAPAQFIGSYWFRYILIQTNSRYDLQMRTIVINKENVLKLFFFSPAGTRSQRKNVFSLASCYFKYKK